MVVVRKAQVQQQGRGQETQSPKTETLGFAQAQAAGECCEGGSQDHLEVGRLRQKKEE